MKRITVAERRARLAARHLLLPSTRTDDPVAAARAVVGLHATDPASVVLSAITRAVHPDPSVVTDALYEDRSLLRMLGMRRTLFTVDRELAPVVHASSSLAVAANERRLLLQLLERSGVADPAEPWLARVEELTLAAIAERGDATANELSAAVPELAVQLPVGEGTAYAGSVGLSSKVLLLLAVDARLVRGRTVGAWTSSKHRWTLPERWLGAPIAEVAVADAQAVLVQHWLERFGPGTEADLKWWTGWSLGAVRAALRTAGAVAVEAERGDGTWADAYVAPGDEDPAVLGIAPPKERWVALLPGLDPTTMGWHERSWYLGPHKDRCFDRNGNAGATVWVDGRVVGGWAQRKDTGAVLTELLEPLPTSAVREVARRARVLEDAIGEVRVTPRFPTPIDKDLRA